MKKLLLAVLAPALFSGCQSQPLPDGCYVKPESGRCRAAITRYYFDDKRQACRPFIWGGCDGVVPFETLDACQAQCPGLDDSDMPSQEDKHE